MIPTLTSVGVQWVLPNLVSNLIGGWKFIGGERKNNVIWEMIPPPLMRCMWQERNRRHFKENELPVVKTKEILLKSFFLLFGATNVAYRISTPDFFVCT